MNDREAWLSNARDRVTTAQHVLSEVDRGLATAEKVEHVAERARPVLRTVTIVVVGGLVAAGIVVLVRRRRRRPELVIHAGGPGVRAPEEADDAVHGDGGSSADGSG